MIKDDQRTVEQKKAHYWGVVGRDKFMSGWGLARGGASRCAWACDSYETAEKIEQAVLEIKKEIVAVNIVDLRTYQIPHGTAHLAIYPVTPDHALLH